MPQLKHIENKLPDDFDAYVVKQIRERLERVRQDSCTVLFAIESGSRAWGFPSPDSDYDCRFVYARPLEDHLLLKPHRDVMEFPIIGDVDTGGWDLKKALLLALNGNAAICEWVDSDICYEEVPAFRDKFAKVLRQITNPLDVAHHYLGLTRSGITRHEIMNSEIKLKKLFYILRPLIALEWMEARDFKKLPPMNFNTNLKDIQIAPDIREVVQDLLDKKRVTKEIGVGETPENLKHFILDMFEKFEKDLPKTQKDKQIREQRLAIAQEFYTSTIQSEA